MYLNQFTVKSQESVHRAAQLASEKRNKLKARREAEKEVIQGIRNEKENINRLKPEAEHADRLREITA